ncbi:MAG: endo-1,4-beta-xylanase [Acidobacteriota bacterium]
MNVAMKASRREFLAMGAMAGVASLAGCARHTGTAAVGTAPGIERASLRRVGTSRGILVGSAVNMKLLRTVPEYAALLREQVGIVVAETAMKFGPLRPSATEFFFDEADALVEFAHVNRMKVRGHNFVWHRALPKWFEEEVTAANAEQVLVEHIEKVGGRYRGKIHSWDVVNEAIELKDGLPGGVRNSPWQKVLPGEGKVPRYIEVAFRAARKADPKALLCYNDYGIETESAESDKKRAAVMELLRAMQAKGVPLDALGVQSHIEAGKGQVYGPGLRGMIAEARSMGVKVLLTEMDVNDRALGGAIPERDAAVAAAYASYLHEALEDPAVIALLTWGISDRYTWLNSEGKRKDGLQERCLPFDAEMKPTAAFEAEIEALRKAPRRH